MVETHNDAFLADKRSRVTVSKRNQREIKQENRDDATSDRCPLDSSKRLHKLLSPSRFIDRCTLLPSDSHGISTMFLPPSPSPSLPLYPILSASTLFPSRVPVSLTSRGYFDWGQTLGFHTIYNAALSNGIEYERG